MLTSHNTNLVRNTCAISFNPQFSNSKILLNGMYLNQNYCTKIGIFKKLIFFSLQVVVFFFTCYFYRYMYLSSIKMQKKKHSKYLSFLFVQVYTNILLDRPQEVMLSRSWGGELRTETITGWWPTPGTPTGEIKVWVPVYSKPRSDRTQLYV